ncbi:MAG: hypothetical protein IKV90_06770 [Clostridia bacterium]|nr:hypothetical protein [Clostridia bacterium]
MKKSNLIAGICSVAVGVICMLIALLTETKLEGILWGLTGAGIAPGVLQILQYLHYNAPENRERYEELLENKSIEMRDELKNKVRNQAGRYAYVAGLMIICVSMLLFSILGALGIVENAQVFVLYLFAYLMVQFILGIVFFNRLMKKY